MVHHHSFKYVVLGGGNSAGYAAREFVHRGVDKGELAIITDEPYVSYERPALSKAYLFPTGAARLPGFHACVGGGGERQDPAWYEGHGITYLTSTRVESADVAAKTLTTAEGDTIGYGKLIVATGARPASLADFKTPGADLKGVHYLRNVADADALLADIPAAKAAGGKAICIGGGYIGMEVSAGLRMNDLDTTMVFPESRLMERLFTPELAAFYEGAYSQMGVALVKGELVTALEGDADGRVATAVLKGGARLPASLVVVGVGARPNTELFAGQLELLAGPPGGIKVDSCFQTSDPDVLAIGDVAAFPLKLTGATTRQEHVTHCRLSAAHAVAGLLAPWSVADYDYLPFFYSRVFSFSWQFYGVNDGEYVQFGLPESGTFGAYWVRDGSVVGAFMEGGSPDDNAAIKKVVQAQPPAPADLAEQGVAFAAKL